MGKRQLRMGIIGGGDYSLIGDTHRLAAALSGIDLVAGVFSSHPDTSRAFAEKLGLPQERSYSHWEEMLEQEINSPPEDRLDGIIIITPNHLHYPIAKAFAESGFSIIVDKPMVHTYAQAEELCRISKEKKIVFAVTYNYTGFPQVKRAKKLIADQEIGKIRKVVVEYSQGWLTRPLEREGLKKAEWRTDPLRSGLSGTIADIGTHAENLVSYTTGLDIEELCADLTTLVPGRKLDDDGNLLIHYRGGGRGVMIASQISCGEGNHLRLRIYGETGGISWDLDKPDSLQLRRENGIPIQYDHNPGPEYQNDRDLSPSMLEAFTCIYQEVAQHIAARGGGTHGVSGFDYPTVQDGARGIRFIERAVASSQEKRWVPF